jgi:hypothetical protein
LPLQRCGVCLARLPLLLRITIYSRQVISLALEARYLEQLDSQYLYPLGSPGDPAVPPGIGCCCGYSLLLATVRGGQTVNQFYCVEILKRLHEAMRRKRPELFSLRLDSPPRRCSRSQGVLCQAVFGPKIDY